MEPLASKLDVGRSYVGSRKIRLGDVSPKGRLRFDALTRYTQDISNDDTTDAGLSDIPGWVVRSTVVDEIVPGRYGETLTAVTFCSGLAKRWAERRLSFTGDAGARYEVATLWVCVDHASGQPHALTDEFLSLYAEAAGGRTSSARQQNPKLRSAPIDSITVDRWQLRKADYDTLGHVNNAAYWAAVEEWLAEAATVPRRARIEYGAGIGRSAQVDIARCSTPDALTLWWLDADAAHPAPQGADLLASRTLASASVAALPDGLYPTSAGS